MFLDILGVITTSKLSILNTFQGGLLEPPLMSSRVNIVPIILLQIVDVILSFAGILLFKLFPILDG